MPIVAPSHLVALVNHLKGTALISQPQPHLDQEARKPVPDLKDVRGQESAKRALAGRGGGRPPHAHDRATGSGQVDAGSAAAKHPSAA